MKVGRIILHASFYTLITTAKDNTYKKKKIQYSKPKLVGKEKLFSPRDLNCDEK
jgi:hypothetical protein